MMCKMAYIILFLLGLMRGCKVIGVACPLLYLIAATVGLVFLFNVGLFVNTATQLYQPVVATSYCKMPKNWRAREDTFVRMYVRTYAYTNTCTHNCTDTKRDTHTGSCIVHQHKYGGITTTSSIA